MSAKPVLVLRRRFSEETGRGGAAKEYGAACILCALRVERLWSKCTVPDTVRYASAATRARARDHTHPPITAPFTQHPRVSAPVTAGEALASTAALARRHIRTARTFPAQSPRGFSAS